MRLGKPGIHLCNRKPVTNMKAIFIILLAVACQAHTPITERSWVKFRKVKYRLMQVLLNMGNQTSFVQRTF